MVGFTARRGAAAAEPKYAVDQFLEGDKYGIPAIVIREGGDGEKAQRNRERTHVDEPRPGKLRIRRG